MLTDGSIVLCYCPIARCGGGLVGFEALMRWRHPRRNLHSPEVFIPISEQSNLILPLAQWALAQACRDAAGWAEPFGISVALTKALFEQDDLIEIVGAALSESRLPPNRLCVEIPETLVTAAPVRSKQMLGRLAELGISVGVGEFSARDELATCLEDYPLSRVRIAPGLVAGIDGSRTVRSIVHLIIEYGHSLGFQVLASEVETEAQLDYLRAEGCDLIQGARVGEPLSIGELRAVIGDTIDSAAVTAPFRRGTMGAGRSHAPETIA
jgi:EAL domain-containing protein (putative c-di-GMP-specific phosphodiesterase class I)